MTQGRARAVIAGGMATAFLACAAPAAPAGTTPLELTPVGGGFDKPTFVTAAPGYGNALFVVEKEGVIRVVLDGAQRTRPFLDLTSRVASEGEQGLLSVAFPSDYRQTRRFYVYYTTARHCSGGRCDIEVDEFKRRRDKRFVARPASRRKVIRIGHRDASNHNGGTAMFGPDGKLWLATGDGGGGGDFFDNARDTTSLLGKLLRINPREPKGASKRGYRIPRSNPFRGTKGRRNQIWSIGLRNPFRFSFVDDPAISPEGPAIAIGDVGQGAREELNIVPVADAKGADFGWPAFEGDQPYDPDRPSVIPASMRIDPIYAYPRPVSPPDSVLRGRSVTGGIFVRDPRLNGTTLDPGSPSYVFGETFESPTLRSLSPDIPAQTFTALQGYPSLAAGGPVGFGEDAQGRVYLADLFGGQVKRIDPAAE